MSTVNKVILIGNLGDEVKMHYFEGGGCSGRFPIATSEHWTDKQTGEKKTATEWHNITVRDKTAEICEKFLFKGSKVYIEGKLKTRKWTDGNQVERFSTEIHARTVQFLSPKGQTESSQSPVDAYHAKHQQQQPESKKEEDHDDLPF